MVSLAILSVTFDCWAPGEVSLDVMSTDGSVCVIAILFPACRPMYGFLQWLQCGSAMHYLPCGTIEGPG